MLIRTRLITALTLSSTIYLVPVFAAHRIDLFGVVLGQGLFQDRELAWKAADVAVGVTVLLLIPGAMALHFAYLYAISSYFLVERDTTPDTSAWREECAVEGFSLDPVRQGISRGLERRGETAPVHRPAARDQSSECWLTDAICSSSVLREEVRPMSSRGVGVICSSWRGSHATSWVHGGYRPRVRTSSRRRHTGSWRASDLIASGNAGASPF